jgi:hypothetical protein
MSKHALKSDSVDILYRAHQNIVVSLNIHGSEKDNWTKGKRNRARHERLVSTHKRTNVTYGYVCWTQSTVNQLREL